MLTYAPVFWYVQYLNACFLVQLLNSQILSLLFKDILLGFLGSFPHRAAEINVMRGSQQSMDVVFCPFFLARILDPQVSNLCFSSLMGWSEVMLGFLSLSKAICLAFFLDPQPLAPCSELANAPGKQNRTEQNTGTYLLASGAISLLLAPCTFIPWLPNLFFSSAFLYVFNRGLISFKILHYAPL